MIERNCKKCNKVFYTYLCKIKVGKGKYCSKQCSNEVTLFKKGNHSSIKTEFKKGQKLSEITKNKMRGRGTWNKNTKGLCKPNKTSFKKGQHYSLNTEFKKGQFTKEKHFNWLGGKSFEPYGLLFNDSLKDKIRQRDDYSCQICNITEEEHITTYGRVFSVHHIDYDKVNNGEDNLTSLCLQCHLRTNYNRDYWQSSFKGVMPVVQRDNF